MVNVPKPPAKPYKIKWGKPGLGKKLEKWQKEDLVKELNDKAQYANHFRFVLTLDEAAFIEKEVDNVHIKQVDFNGKLNATFIVGVDEETIQEVYNKI